MQFKLSIIAAVVLAASGALALPTGLEDRQIDCSVFKGQAQSECAQY